MLTKKKFMLKNEDVYFDFDELYVQFYNAIQKETFKMKSKYGGLFSRNEIEQQFTIELWNAFNTYDYEMGTSISTHVHYRFALARRELVRNQFLTNKAKFRNEAQSLDKEVFSQKGDSIDLYDTASFSEKVQTPEEKLLDDDFLELVSSVCKNEEDADLIRIMLDSKDFSVQNYADKYDMSRMGVYVRLKSIKKKIKKLLDEENLIG